MKRQLRHKREQQKGGEMMSRREEIHQIYPPLNGQVRKADEQRPFWREVIDLLALVAVLALIAAAAGTFVHAVVRGAFDALRSTF